MTALTRFDLASMTRDQRRRLTHRSAVPDPEVSVRASAICREVATGGDAAAARYGDTLGGGWRRVEGEEIEAALDRIAFPVLEAIQTAAAAIRQVHADQLPRPTVTRPAEGVTIERRWHALRRVGAYVPGGQAAYPSTVLMTVVPAAVAGVQEIVVVSPERRDGTLPDAMLAACRIAGATEVWAGGGAQAIAALAHGTQRLAPVDKIVGPGNAYVTAAKLAVFGTCAIDLPAGPSEVLVLADASADPRLIAIDLLCQAEHGPDSPAVLVTTDPGLPAKVDAELDAFLGVLDRADILSKALAGHGVAVVAPSRQEALAFVNDYASEHVSVLTAEAEADAAEVTAAGSVFVGRWAPESAGDYATGANHVLPTGGLARACGPLSTEDFGSWRQVQRISRSGLETLAPTISALAAEEGLDAHRLAATVRLEPGPGGQ